MFQPGDIEFLIIMFVFGTPIIVVFIGIPLLVYRLVERLENKRKDIKKCQE